MDMNHDKNYGHLTKEQVRHTNLVLLWALLQTKEHGPMLEGAGICANALEYIEVGEKN